MAHVRARPGGRWEVTVRRKGLLPKPLTFSFATEADAAAYGQQCEKWLAVGVVPDALKAAVSAAAAETLGGFIRAYRNSGEPAVSEGSILDLLFIEVGAVEVDGFGFGWAEGWVRSLKRDRILAPGSIRKRVQTLSRAVDWTLRRNAAALLHGNPLKLLPRGYSTYNEQDAEVLAAVKKEVRSDVERDRRLHPGEEDRILRALSGEKRLDKERALRAEQRDEMHMLFALIVSTGVRLREAYMLRRGSVMLDRKILRVQSSKQWRGRVRYREIPLRPDIHAALAAYMATSAAAHDDLLFPFWDGSPDTLASTTSRLSRRFTTLFGYADCEGLTEHDLRHEATCRWFELRDQAGGWLLRDAEINRIMGWRPGSKMAQRYASFRAEDLTDRLWAGHAPG